MRGLAARSPRLPIVLLLAVIVAPSATPAADIPGHPRAIDWPEEATERAMPRVQRFELASGPVVYLAPDGSLPLVEIAVALRGGSLADPPELTGLASLTGAMIRRAGAGEMPADAFDEAVDDLGARIDTMAGTTRAGASLSVLTDRLDPALELFFRMLSRPGFAEDQVENARSSLIESMGRRDQDPLEILEREWEWLLYGNLHPTTRPLTGVTVAALEPRLLAEHHRRAWRPDRMILAVSGDFTTAELLSRLEAGFASWPETEKKPNPGDTDALPAPPPVGSEPGLYHYQSASPQAKVAFGRRLEGLLPWDDPDRPGLALTMEILGGGGAISRLAGRLRTAEGLVYRVSTAIEAGDLWPGELRIVFDTAAAGVAPALRAALQEIDRLRREPVHPLELEIARRTLLSRLLLDSDTAEEIAGRAAENELLGRPTDYWDLYRRGLEAVDADDVRRLANRLLEADKLVYLVVGPWEEISGGGSEAARNRVERVVGHPAVHLPRRDPQTMEPVVASAPEE